MSERDRVRFIRLLVVLPALAACSAPAIPVESGMREFPTDIVYGAGTEEPVQPAPAPAADLTPAFPGFIAPPPPQSAVTPIAPPPPDPCPIDPFAVPATPAGPYISAPPVAGVYEFRQSGSSLVGDGPAVVLPERVERHIDAIVEHDTGGFSYDQVIEELGARTTTTYRVHPGDDPAAGLYLTRVLTNHADGSVEEFLPAGRGLHILPSPATVGTTWQSVATDPLRTTSIRIEATLVERRRVDGCGEAIDGWAVDVTGSILGLIGSDKNLDLEASYVVAPQHGGLIVAETVTISGVDQGAEVTQQRTATINTVIPQPLPPETA